MTSHLQNLLAINKRLQWWRRPLNLFNRLQRKPSSFRRDPNRPLHGQNLALERPSRSNTGGLTINGRLARWTCYAGLLSTFGLTGESAEPKDARHYIEDAIKRAIYSHKELGDAKAAEKQLHLALKTAQEMMDEQAVTYIFDALANLALETGRMDDAEKLFVETMKRLLQSGMSQDDDAIVEISVKLADVHAAKGRTDVAEIGYIYCLDILQMKLSTASKSVDDNTSLLWAMSSDAYGRFLMRTERYAEAQKRFGDALDVCRRVHGPMHPQTLVIVNNVGGACAMLGDYEQAAVHLQNAANIAGTIGSSDLSAYYRNLGIVYLQMGRVNDATLACRRALQIGTESHDRDMERQANECLQKVKQHKNTVS